MKVSKSITLDLDLFLKVKAINPNISKVINSILIKYFDELQKDENNNNC